MNTGHSYRLVICSKSSTGIYSRGTRVEDRSTMRHVCLFCSGEEERENLVLSNRVRPVFVSRLDKHV